jgi:predicted DNA-binding protein YlxM (UPF0122 family)
MRDTNTAAIVSAYEAGTSMTEIARAHRISRQTVRRILIDAGAYANTNTVYAKRRLDEGADLDTIAAELEISRNALIQSLPHTRGLYGQQTATKNAKTIRAMRARRKETAE